MSFVVSRRAAPDEHVPSGQSASLDASAFTDSGRGGAGRTCAQASVPAGGRRGGRRGAATRAFSMADAWTRSESDFFRGRFRFGKVDRHGIGSPGGGRGMTRERKGEFGASTPW